MTSYLERLLDGARVDWKSLGDIALIKTGESVSKQKIADNPGEYPVINSGREPLGYINAWNTEDDPIGITSRGAGVGSITWQEGRYFRGSLNYSVTLRTNGSVNVKYLYHILQLMQREIQALCTYDGIPALNAGNLKELQIPVPCTENIEKSRKIQDEIARILDTFIALKNELSRELIFRKKQYEFYGLKLFSSKDVKFEWKTLEDVCGFTYGYAAKALDEGDARFVRITDISSKGKLIPTQPKYVNITSESKKYLLNKNDVLVARTGATFGKTMIFSENYPAIFAGFLIKLEMDKSVIDPKYYWHFAQSCLYWEQANQLVSGGGQQQFNANVLKGIKIPIPFVNDSQKSLEEQARVVAVLDIFDAITENLASEISLRQTQYEHYRNLLLDFQGTEKKVC